MDGQHFSVVSVNKDRCVDCGFCRSVLDYFPTFRRQNLHRPHLSEMLKAKRTLEGAGLRMVVVQTAMGHLGPG